MQKAKLFDLIVAHMAYLSAPEAMVLMAIASLCCKKKSHTFKSSSNIDYLATTVGMSNSSVYRNIDVLIAYGALSSEDDDTDTRGRMITLEVAWLKKRR